MGRQRFFSFLIVGSLITSGPWLAEAQQPSTQAGRPAGPRSATTQPPQTRTPPPRTAQPQIIARPQAAANAARARMPEGFPLNPQQNAWVDEFLRYWEHHTSKIKTHQCKFERRNYDFVFGSRETPKSVDYGTIRYKAPDKGLMRVDTVYTLNPQAKDAKEQFVKQDVEYGEYWVCDGESIYQFDARTKVLTETKLAPEMRGKAIGEGPLPFLFGAKAKTMKERYWIREVTPKDNPQGEYFLEATPKRQAEAANFDRLLVQLAVTKGRLFPKAMRLISKQGYILYEFQDHSPNDPVHRVQGFLDSFVRPRTPMGWTKVVEDWNGDRGGERRAAKPDRGSRQLDARKQR